MAETKRRIIIEVGNAEQALLVKQALVAQAKLITSLGSAQTPDHKAVVTNLLHGSDRAASAATRYRKASKPTS